MAGSFRRMASASRAVGADRILHRAVGAINGADTEEPIFHMTFDDGPHPTITPRILDVLRAHNAAATFFVLVGSAQEQSELVREILSRGHEVGLHTRTHRRLSTLPWRSLVDEIVTARRDLEAAIGERVRWFRPPYGAQGVRAVPLVRAAGMTTVNWTVDSSDWKGVSGDDPLSEAVGEIDAGGILLLHDTPVDPTRVDPETGFIPKHELTDRYLTAIEERGLSHVSLSRLLSTGRPIRQARLS